MYHHGTGHGGGGIRSIFATQKPDIGGGWLPAPPGAMKMLVWNCRGLANHETVQSLKRQIWLLNADLVFVSETRLHRNKVDSLRRKMGMQGVIEVEHSDDCVGLLFMWKDSIDVQLLSFSSNS